MIDLLALQKAVIEFRDARDWKQFHTPKDSAISMVLEATEFLEHFQWKNAEEIQKHLTDKKSDVADELADVLFWVLTIAHDQNIHLEEALLAKLERTSKKYPVDKVKGRHLKHTELKVEAL